MEESEEESEEEKDEDDEDYGDYDAEKAALLAQIKGMLYNIVKERNLTSVLATFEGDGPTGETNIRIAYLSKYKLSNKISPTSTN